ncbi:MAG: UpxY family transcription antiterminator [Arcticibacter sp.]
MVGKVLIGGFFLSIFVTLISSKTENYTMTRIMNKPFLSKKDSNVKAWMVIYTRSKWEKKVDRLLKEKGVESFCPLVRTNRKWADRNMLVDLPLFTSYLFVHISPFEQSLVRETMGVINFIYYSGKPAVVDNSDIDRIRMIVGKYKDVETISIRDLSSGDRIKITQGALANLEGEVIEVKGKSVLISIRQLDCVLIAKVAVNQNILITNPGAGAAVAVRA